jgi:hypothetical protein
LKGGFKRSRLLSRYSKEPVIQLDLRICNHLKGLCSEGVYEQIAFFNVEENEHLTVKKNEHVTQCPASHNAPDGRV